MSKIVIVGAGVGGLILAYELEGKGHEVTILEKNTKKGLSYDWYDDVENSVIDEFKIDLSKIRHFLKQDWAFIFPEVEKIIALSVPDEKKDISIHRRDLSTFLMERLKETTIDEGNAAKEAICKDGKVIGIKTNKGDVFGDLIVDCCGVDSFIRKSLPDEFGITKEIDEDDIFNVYRGFYKRTDAEKEEFTNKAYLRHLGRKGISWALDKEDHIDVLIGNAGKFTKSALDVSFEHLLETNKTLSSDLIESAVCRIPVRRPLEKMFANGYVALGDSACMTIPMLGSGIASSMRAGKILASVILEANGVYTEETLYPYQVRVAKRFGSIHAAIDVLKRWLLEEKPEAIAFFINREVVLKEDMQAAAEGKTIEIKTKDLLTRGFRGISKPGLMLKLAKVLSKQSKAQKLWFNIPKTYDAKSFEKWRKSSEKIFRK